MNIRYKFEQKWGKGRTNFFVFQKMEKGHEHKRDKGLVGEEGEESRRKKWTLFFMYEQLKKVVDQVLVQNINRG